MLKQKQFISIYERRGLCPYPSFYGEANTKDVGQYLGIALGIVLFDFQNNFFRLCLDKNEVREVGSKILEDLKEGKIKPEVIQQQLTEFATKAINETINFKKCLKQASREDLAGFLTRFSYLMTQVIALGDSICFLPEQQATSEFEKGLFQAVRSNKIAAQISPLLLRFDKLSFAGREECELFQVVQSGNEKNLKEHTKKWTHLAFDYTGPVTKYKEFLQRYQKLQKQDLSKKIETCQNYEQKVREEKFQIIKKYNIPKEVVLLAKIISHTNFIYDLRKSFLTKMTYEFSFVLDKVAEVCGVERQWVNWLLPQEVIALLEDKFKPTRTVIQNRQEDGLIVFQKGQGHWADREEKRMYRGLIEKQVAGGDVQEIKGKPASGGKAQGRVARVIGPAHLNKMTLGDVLVAPMTSVDYMPAIRLAAAIVTDIGGLTSHAAVIARELQIPCIVGTKIATQVLKDGDEVEVDANQGLVKILKRK